MANLGLYCGSFDPFHKGHFNILLKSEVIFDKVIIGFGKNPEKDKPHGVPPEAISDRIKIFYEGLLTDVIEQLENEGHNVTLIRGLRNSTDLQYELTQYRYLQEIKPDIKVVSIFCDKEYEHISSSAIRMLAKYGKADQYLLK